MRTIKFRGKRTDTKEWVYGGISIHSGKSFIITVKRYVPDTRDSDIADYYEKHKKFEPYLIEVIPETVGQFTGLTDKNGKEIYEGDIVNYEIIYYDNRTKPFVGTVVFVDCSFGIENNSENVNNCYLLQIMQYGSTDEIEVIGNIHENGELIK